MKANNISFCIGLNRRDRSCFGEVNYLVYGIMFYHSIRDERACIKIKIVFCLDLSCMYICVYTHTLEIHRHTIKGAYILLLVLESKIQILDE